MMHTTLSSRKWMVWVVVLSVTFAGSAAAQEEEGKEAKDVSTLSTDLTPRRAIVLTMADAVRLTLQNSMDIKIDRIGPQTRAADIIRAESEFDWTFVGSWSGGRSITPSASALAGATAPESDTDQLKLGLRKDLKTGGEIEPTLKWDRGWSNSAFATLNPSYTTDAYITISQPLLRNAGYGVSTSDIHLARNNADISRYLFKQNVINTIGDMERTYWDLVFAIEDLDVEKKSLRLTKDTLEQTRAQVEAGLLAPIEITRVRADVEGKEESILNAKNSVEDKEDQLRRFINQRSSSLVEDVGVIPFERTAYRKIDLVLEREIREALLHRPDYQSAKLDIRNRHIELAVAKNAKLPVVDISATLSMNGLGSNTGNSFEQLRTNDFHDWSAAVSVEIPFGNRSAKAGYLQARLAKTRALLELKNLEHEVIIQVKEGVRQVQTNLKRIRSTRLARELAEERLRAEEEKFNVGTALILDVLEAQTKLARAESAENRSIVDYNKSLIALERAKGTLLERNRVYLSEELGPPAVRR